MKIIYQKLSSRKSITVALISYVISKKVSHPTKSFNKQLMTMIMSVQMANQLGNHDLIIIIIY